MPDRIPTLLTLDRDISQAEWESLMREMLDLLYETGYLKPYQTVLLETDCTYPH